MSQLTIWTGLFWLIIIFFVMLILNRWITLHVRGLGYIISMNEMTATWIYFFIFFPGIFLHELSHFLVATLLQAQPSRFSLWPEPRQGRIILGAVEVRNAGPLKHSLIGAAPLVIGSVTVLLIARLLQFDRLGEALLDANLDQLSYGLIISLEIPDFWLWLYLLFAISNAMLPSPADRIYWTPVFLFLGGIGVILLGFGWLPDIPLLIQDTFTEVVSLLVFALTTVVIVNLFFIMFIFLMETILVLATGRKIQY